MSNLKLKPLQWQWIKNEWVARTIVGHYSVYYVGAWSAYKNAKHIFTAPHHVLDGLKDSAEATLCKQKCEEDLLNKIKEHLMECECPVSNLIGKTVELVDYGRGRIIGHEKGFVHIMLFGEGCKVVSVKDTDLIPQDAEGEVQP